MESILVKQSRVIFVGMQERLCSSVDGTEKTHGVSSSLSGFNSAAAVLYTTCTKDFLLLQSSYYFKSMIGVIKYSIWFSSFLNA